jgi:hypothetical protein
MIRITSVDGETGIFPDYIFSTKRVRFVESDYVFIDNVQYIRSTLVKTKGADGEVAKGGNYPLVTDLPFDGNRPVKRAGLPLVNPASHSVKTFLEKYFYPFSPATIRLPANESIYELGIQFESNIRVFITPNDEKQITNRRLIDVSKGNVVIGMGEENTWDNRLLLSGIQDIYAVDRSRLFKAMADVGGNGTPETIQSNVWVFRFVKPFFFGMSSELLSSDNLYQSLTKQLHAETVRDYSLQLNGTDKYIYIATSLHSSTPVIRDHNGFDVSQSFIYQAMQIKTPNLYPQWTSVYHIWRTEVPTTVANKTFTVKFS